MDKDQWIDYRELQRAGWAVQKTNQIRLNGGSESKDHVAAKALVAHIGHNAGYRVSSEVVHAERGEIDILLHGHADRITLAVECESNPTDDVIDDKVRRYVKGTPIDDIAIINLDVLPDERPAAYSQIKEVLGL